MAIASHFPNLSNNPQIPEISSQNSFGSRSRSIQSHQSRSYHTRNLPPRPPAHSSHYTPSPRRVSSLQLSSSDSVSHPSSSGMIPRPPVQQRSEEVIELVGIEENEGTWTGTKVAAITGGRESVQKVSQKHWVLTVCLGLVLEVAQIFFLSRSGRNALRTFPFFR